MAINLSTTRDELTLGTLSMDLSSAEALITSYLRRIDAIYLQTLFDEWAILGLSAKGETLIAYQGPRKEAYLAKLPQDSRPLREAMTKQEYHVGDFEFAIEAHGDGYDACLKIGEAAYLVCNNLAATMNQLRKDPQWLKVQPLWFELAQKFHDSPLV